jgi:hypothetical protein
MRSPLLLPPLLLLFIYTTDASVGLVPWTQPWGSIGPPPPPDRKLLMASHRLELHRRRWEAAHSGGGGGGGRWWAQPEAVAEVLRQLRKHSFAIVDGFQGSEIAAGLREELVGLRRAGGFSSSRIRGADRNQSAQGAAGADAAPAAPDEGAKASFLRGDEIAWLPVGSSGQQPSGHDGRRARRHPAVAQFVSRLDEFVTLLLGAPQPEQTVEEGGGAELGGLRYRSDAMATCYPPSARYIRHTDNSCSSRARASHSRRCNGRRLTAIGYLNEPSGPSVGGALRIYAGGDPLSSPPRVDVQPEIDRLLLFYSDDRVPHEVLPAERDRYAVTVWYYDEEEAALSDTNVPLNLTTVT